MEEIQNDEVYVFTDEDGNEIEMEHIATTEINDKEYYYFTEYSKDEKEILEYVVLEAKIENEEIDFIPVEDPELLAELEEEFDRLLQEDSCDCDDDECEHHHED